MSTLTEKRQSIYAAIPLETFLAYGRKGSAISNEHRPSVSWTVKDKNDDAKSSRGDGEKKEKGGDNLGKEIGLLYGGSLVMNAIIGPGIFGTPKGVLAGVGSVGMSMVMWTFSGLLSMCAALCFAELRESVKREGVEYAYITECFGPLAAAAYSWMRIAAAEPTATAVFALAFTDYVADAIYDKCGPPKPFVIIVATLTLLSMFLVNVMSTKLSERLQMLSTVGKVSALSVVIIMGVKRMVEGKLEVINEGFKASVWSPTELGFACYNGLWAYGGWANVNHVTSGIKKPPRNVPRIVKTILPLVLVIYLLTVLSYFTAMTREQLLHSRAIGVTWAERVLGPGVSSIISIGVGLTALGSLNGTFLSAGRLSGVAAKNGQMPDVAAWVHVRSKTPLVATAMRCLIAILVVCMADGQQLLRFNIFIVWMFHGTSILALLILRYKNKKKKRPYKVDLWIPVVAVIGISYLLIAPFLQNPKNEFVAALVLLAMSLVSYYPLEWLKSKFVITVPDKLTIWLQLFLRIAPKRDLRRERRSMLRRMSMLARDSILMTPNALSSPSLMRRFSRRMSRLSRLDASPVLIRHLADDQAFNQLRRRNRGMSLAEDEIHKQKQRGRSSSLWAFGTEYGPSQAIIRKKPTRESSRSLNHTDIAKLKSPPSLPILKNRYNTTPEATTDSKPGALAPAKVSLATPHSALRQLPSPIIEEDNKVGKCKDSNAEDSRSFTSDTSSSPQDNDLQIIANFESDGGGEYQVLARPDDARSMSYNADMGSEHNSDTDSTTDSDDSSSSDSAHDLKHSIFASLFSPTSSSSSSSSDSDSSLDEEGSSDEDGVHRSAATFYHSSDDDKESDYSERNGAYVNNGFVVNIEDEQEQRQHEPQHQKEQQHRLHESEEEKEKEAENVNNMVQDNQAASVSKLEEDKKQTNVNKAGQDKKHAHVNIRSQDKKQAKVNNAGQDKKGTNVNNAGQDKKEENVSKVVTLPDVSSQPHTEV